MSLKDFDVDAALRRVAERQIDEAMREGKFDNIQGKGQPIDLEPLPADENARMMWWALRIMRKNDFLPDEIRYRVRLDALKSRIRATKDVKHLTAAVAEYNTFVGKLNRMGTNVISSTIALLDLDEELRLLRERGSPIC